MSKERAKALCKDFVWVVVGTDGGFSTITLKADQRMPHPEGQTLNSVCIIDPELAQALKIVLEGE